jgi:hypothetical protein
VIAIVILIEFKQINVKYILILLLTQVVVNLPFVLVNPNLINLGFLWDVFTHPPKFIVGLDSLMLLARFSFSIPTLWLFWQLVNYIQNKSKSSKSVNYRWRIQRKEEE